MTPENFVNDHLSACHALLGDPDLTRRALEVLEALAPDDVNKPALLAWLREGLEQGERRWEIRTALRALAHVIQPRSYLEIGTRRGWSLAQVLAEAPAVHAYCFDLWMENYGGTANPGPEFLREEVIRAAPDFRGQITFLSGNSHDLLPVFFEGAVGGEPPAYDLLRHFETRPHQFDLITVDGDHTALGAWWDLLDVMPHVALGGAVVFDDLLDKSDERMGDHPASRFANRYPPLVNFRPSLLDVWQRVKRVYGNFTYIENFEAKPPIGIALRAE